VTVMIYRVLSVGKWCFIVFCFKTAYRNCGSECANVTASMVRLCLECFRLCSWKEGLFCFPISNRTCDDLQSSLNNKLSHTAITVLQRNQI
jgi:hypothetical protein